MTEDELDQLEAGLVRLKGGVCVSSDLEVAAADAIARLRAELAAERERVIEECAKVAEDSIMYSDTTDPWDDGWDRCAQEIADKLRALKGDERD